LDVGNFDLNEIIADAIYNKNPGAKAIEIILKHPKFNPLINHNDPNVDYNDAIIDASFAGRLDIIELLLQNNKVDPTLYDNAPIKIAFEEGYSDIVARLLKDPRVIALSPNIVETFENETDNMKRVGVDFYIYV
jgi:ankyrin repeat protein